MRITSLIGVVLAGVIIGCTDSTVEWIHEDGFRFRELDVKGRTRTGFAEVAAERSGITAENYVSMDAIIKNRHMMHGSGIAIGDVTGDQMPDVYVARLTAPDVLYRNLGNWEFEDISNWSGLGHMSEATSGVVMVDLDGDHDLDLLLTMPLGPGAVYQNTGEGQFKRVPGASGLHSPYASTTTTLADIDQDGDLDAYIARYKRISLADSLPPEAMTWDAVLQKNTFEPKEDFRTHYRFTKSGSRVIRSELAEPDGLYLNDGSGHFSEVSWTRGRFLDENGDPLTSIPRDWALAAKFYDLTGDGIADLYVCNDFDSPDELWIGLKDGRFQRAPHHALRKTSNATMSVDFADVNQDGIMDFFTTDMLSRDYSKRQRQRNTRIPIEAPAGDEAFRPQEMQNALMIGRGDTTFAELAWFAEVAASDWSWATSFMDIDLDGWEDLLITTGHVFDVQDLDAQMMEQRRIASSPSWKASRALLLDFPPLALANVAFRNRRDLTFEDMPEGWGFGHTADIAHGMALGDLDADGDLDIVTNRFNASPGVYQNTTGADRIAVMLEGKPPNTAGVGAEIRVQCADTPEQIKQMSAGGGYLSSNQMIAVFAVNAAPCQIEVIWDQDRISYVPVDEGNRLYVIEHSGAVEIQDSISHSAENPLYELSRTYAPQLEHEFDDFALQPLLPWRLSRRGPALATVDFDGDGRFELLEGSGKNHRLRLSNKPILDSLQGDATGLLALPVGEDIIQIMVAESNYERLPDSSWIHVYDMTSDVEVMRHQKLPFGRSTPGPLSVADLDLDGDLDLFAGGSFVPAGYPSAADSRIYINEEEGYVYSPEFSKPLRQLGLINGSVFGDLNGDGYSDLVLAQEWGPIRVFQGSANGWMDQTESLGLTSFNGWWRGVALGDFDGDGALDIVASNAGWNHRYGRSTPVRLQYGDFNVNGRMDLFESFLDPETAMYRPSRMLSELVHVLAPIQMQFSSHRAFSTANADKLIPVQGAAGTRSLETNTYASSVFLNRGDHFEQVPLHNKAQHTVGVSPVVLDANLDGNEDLVLSQNWFAYPVSTPRQDAGRALLLFGNGDGTFNPAHRSGFEVYGEGRGVAIGDFDGDFRDEIAFAQHGGPTLVYQKTEEQNGVPIRFDYPSDAIGVILRAVYPDGRHGPARIITAGSGYWSQGAIATTLGLGDNTLAAIEVTWPGQDTRLVNPEEGSRVIYLKK